MDVKSIIEEISTMVDESGVIVKPERIEGRYFQSLLQKASVMGVVTSKVTPIITDLGAQVFKGASAGTMIENPEGLDQQKRNALLNEMHRLGIINMKVEFHLSDLAKTVIK